jgi:hypothetical protein
VSPNPNKYGAHHLRVRSLLGDDFVVKSEAGHWLLACRNTRASLSWIRPYAYAWFKLQEDLKQCQRRLLEIRRRRP